MSDIQYSLCHNSGCQSLMSDLGASCWIPHEFLWVALWKMWQFFSFWFFSTNHHSTTPLLDHFYRSLFPEVLDGTCASGSKVRTWKIWGKKCEYCHNQNFTVNPKLLYIQSMQRASTHITCLLTVLATMATGSLSWKGGGYSDRVVALTTHPNLTQKLKKE